MAEARLVLIPYDPQDSISAKQAARNAGCCVVTVKTWCGDHGIGRKVGGRWRVSRAALAMFLEGNQAALAAYHRGERNGELVGPYFKRH